MEIGGHVGDYDNLDKSRLVVAASTGLVTMAAVLLWRFLGGDKALENVGLR